jgi:hypothetical protein
MNFEDDETLMKVCILYTCWKKSEIPLDYESVDINNLIEKGKPVTKKYVLCVKSVHYYKWLKDYQGPSTVEHYMESRKLFDKALLNLMKSNCIISRRIYPEYLRKEGAYALQFFLTCKGLKFLKQHEELLESLKEVDKLEEPEQ